MISGAVDERPRLFGLGQQGFGKPQLTALTRATEQLLVSTSHPTTVEGAIAAVKGRTENARGDAAVRHDPATTEDIVGFDPRTIDSPKMGLSGLLGSTSGRNGNRKNLTTPSTVSVASTASMPVRVPARPEFISGEDHLYPVEPEAPNLRDLNACLEALAVVFPDIQIEVFREMLSHFDGESRLEVVADTLLKNRVEWVKGRWRARKTDGTGLVPKNETFRDEGYKDAVKALAWHEFRGLSRSTINAVLAESNYSYLDARRALVNLSSKSWRFAISTLFSSRRKVLPETEPENHPLVIWRSTGRGSIEPCIKPTGNAELDRELYDLLVAPILHQRRAEQEQNDHRFAIALNNTEAEDAQDTIECACCYADCAFEEFTSCNMEGHMICFRCVQHSLTEAVFGQGWQRSIDKDTGTLRCPAVASEECQGCIPQDQMFRAMLEEPKGPEILRRLDLQLTEQNLISSGMPLIRCPFCPYAAMDDVYLPQGSSRSLTPQQFYNIMAIASLLLIPFVLPLVLATLLVCLLASLNKPLRENMSQHLCQAVARRRRRQFGLRFKCENPECGRSSCLNCGKEWIDVHICNESSLVALRTQVEQAMSLAVKRVCPRCNMSFVKTSGCNKLKCPCGYSMCYVCRKDIGGNEGPDAGYQHFCSHFRPEGDPKACTQCKKCNLWESEDTERVLEQAKREAERKWFETENRELSGAEKTYLETGMTVDMGPRSLDGVWRHGRLPSVNEIFDILVEFANL